MTVNAISNSYATAQVGMFNRAQSASSTTSTSSTDLSSSTISNLSDLMKQLESLAQSDPTKFKQVAATISQKLTDAAKAATDGGDTAKAKALTDLAEKFKTASEDGKMPDLKPPQGGPPMGPPPSDSSDSTSTDSSSSTSTTSSTSAAAQYKQFMAMFEQASNSDPMSMLESTIADALKSQSS